MSASSSHSRLRRAGALACILAAVSLPVSPAGAEDPQSNADQPGVAAPTYAVIGMGKDRINNLVHFVAAGGATAAQAQQLLSLRCRNLGVAGCTTLVTATRGECMALAVGEFRRGHFINVGYGVGKGPTRVTARTAAIADCRRKSSTHCRAEGVPICL